ncbi:hypothetical protein GCM10027174_17370 [Salinifilum aidingensis]
MLAAARVAAGGADGTRASPSDSGGAPSARDGPAGTPGSSVRGAASAPRGPSGESTAEVRAGSFVRSVLSEFTWSLSLMRRGFLDG